MSNYILYDNFGFTTKRQGYSKNEFSTNNMVFHSGDKYKSVLKNRKQLAKQLGFKLDDFVFANQTHSNNYYKVSINDKGRGAYNYDSAIKNTDALYTFENNIVLATSHADCTPIYFQAKTHHLIGVIHAGWLGTAREITFKTLEHIIIQYQIKPDEIEVFIGPTISKNIYEVQTDVYKQMQKYHSAFTFKDDKIFLDNRLANIIQLHKLGIEHINYDTRCTYSNENLFFSYRRNQDKGRMIAFIYQKN